jgi:formylglycine-generating enzyme required for sulfatase activity/TolB-like protein
MKRSFFYAVLIVVCSGCGLLPGKAASEDPPALPPVPTISLDEAIEEAAMNLLEKVPPDTAIAVINIISPNEWFSDYLIEELNILLINDGRLNVIDRKTVERVRHEQLFQLSDELSDESLQVLGQILDVSMVVTGSLVKMNNTYRFRVKALDARTAKTQAASSVSLSTTDEQIIFLLNTTRSLTVGLSAGGRPATPARTPETPAPGASIPAPAIGALSVTTVTAGTVNLAGAGVNQNVYLPAGGRWNRSDAAAGTYTLTMRYADGQSESQTVTVAHNQTAPVAFVYQPTAAPGGFVLIPSGRFIMGSSSLESGRDNDEVQHTVIITRAFYIGKFEITIEDFRHFINATDYKTTAETAGGGSVWVSAAQNWETRTDAQWKNPYFSQQDSQPVVMISWYDAIEYCNWRSQQEGLTPAYTRNSDTVTWNQYANGYRLPTEAEWEYACRAGASTPFSTGAAITTSQANYDGNFPYSGSVKGTYRQKTTPTGNFVANAWGLFDMHGNVLEWCWDYYGIYSGSQTDPTGAASGTDRAARGGSWFSPAQYVRSAYRASYNPMIRSAELGFRVVRYQ